MAAFVLELGSHAVLGGLEHYRAKSGFEILILAGEMAGGWGVRRSGDDTGC